MKQGSLPVTVIIMIAGLLYTCSCNSNDKTSKEATQKKGSANARLERGRYLVETVGSCMHCHSQRDFTKFSGPVKEETKGMGGVGYPIFGTLYSSNITPDTATGIGRWTDDEIVRAITLGIRKNGDTLFPIMPYYEYNKMSKEDAFSIVAYLRSLKPVVNKIPERKLKSPAGPEHDLFEYASLDNNQPPPANDSIQTGKYLAAVGGCITCHTPKTDDERFEKDKYYGGGDGMGRKFGFQVYSSNITPDTATGIGNWTEKSFLDKFKSFRNPQAYSYDPGKHNTLMPWIMLAQMKDEDIKAIYAYLRTVKPIRNKVEKWPPEKK
ncbi:MAG: cytochrome c [Bacteroidota bacterium]|nr:cytochrome c [Bacteroidota bacterium]